MKIQNIFCMNLSTHKNATTKENLQLKPKVQSNKILENSKLYYLVIKVLNR